MKHLPAWLFSLLVLGLAAYAWHKAPEWSGQRGGAPAVVRAPSRPPKSSTPPPPLTPPWDAESQRSRLGLLERQPQILARTLGQVRPQRPGRIDLYTLGFAGDGEERVFANEVEYFEQLMARRFDAQGHTLSLVNSPKPGERFPLATLPNLRAALKGMAAHMDREEDVLVLFLTSHGSRHHELVVDLQLPPRMLEQVSPPELRKALDESGIRWRVVIVSACYSGGFVNDLRDPRTLVITAARSDRSSFGCGHESRITWFGDAYLAGALNETTDFQRAFELARQRIREWEKAEREPKASEPQIWTGADIGAKLTSWRKATPPGPRVPFAGK